MRILILEDETLVATSLIRMVKELEPDCEIIGPIQTVAGTREWFLHHSPPDLILSDIQLADGISIDLFISANIPVPVIFTTAFNEYAIRAFKLNSVDYLLKPVDRDELRTALQKFHLLQSKYKEPVYLEDLRQLFNNFGTVKPYKERFAVHVGRSVTLLALSDVAYFIKEELIYLAGANGKKYITDYRSLDEVEELVDATVFFRANRQHLVHLPMILSYRSDDTGKVYLKMRHQPSDEIVVSKERASEFRKWFA